MSCDVGEVTEGLENERSSAVTELILQPFRRFTYVTAHFPTLPLLHLRHSSFSNTSFAFPTSQDLHLRHLASRPWHLDGVGWLILHSVTFIPGKTPGTHFYRRPNGPENQSEQEGVKEKFPPLQRPGSNSSRPAFSQSFCRLS